MLPEGQMSALWPRAKNTPKRHLNCNEPLTLNLLYGVAGAAAGAVAVAAAVGSAAGIGAGATAAAGAVASAETAIDSGVIVSRATLAHSAIASLLVWLAPPRTHSSHFVSSS